MSSNPEVVCAWPTSLHPLLSAPSLPIPSYRHFALVQGVQEEGHAVRAQVAVLAGEVVCHLQQVLLLERVALVGKGQLGDVDRVLGKGPVSARGAASAQERLGLAHREPPTHLSCPWLYPFLTESSQLPRKAGSFFAAAHLNR